jgi:hypothetical protein
MGGLGTGASARGWFERQREIAVILTERGETFALTVLQNRR